MRQIFVPQRKNSLKCPGESGPFFSLACCRRSLLNCAAYSLPLANWFDEVSCAAVLKAIPAVNRNCRAQLWLGVSPG